MKNLSFWTLMGLNLVLLTALATNLARGPVAVAQQAPVANARDDYLLVPGEINGGNNAIVYVIDETTHQLSSMSYDDSMRRLTTMAPRDMNRDFLDIGMNPQGRRR